MTLYRKIDVESGLFIEDVILKEPPTDKGEYISTPVLGGLYAPKWNGTEWIEGLSEEEITELNKPVPQEPTLEERLQMAEDTIMFMLMGGM